jgi:hypothetical protein
MTYLFRPLLVAIISPIPRIHREINNTPAILVWDHGQKYKFISSLQKQIKVLRVFRKIILQNSRRMSPLFLFSELSKRICKISVPRGPFGEHSSVLEGWDRNQCLAVVNTVMYFFVVK